MPNISYSLDFTFISDNLDDRFSTMHILVIGSGSIGTRHAENILKLGARVSIYSRTRRVLDERFRTSGVSLITDWSSIDPSAYDAIVIANTTEQHEEFLRYAASFDKPVYVEKPISCTLDGLDSLVAELRHKNLYVECGFMFRCNPNLVWMKRQIETGKIGRLLYARSLAGQYLGDWRPGTDMDKGYTYSQERGGGVIFDLVHEIDIIYWLFGLSTQVSAMKAYPELLKKPTESIAQMLLCLENGALAQISVDCVRPTYHREIELVGELGVIKWDDSMGTCQMTIGKDARPLSRCLPVGYTRNDMFLTYMKYFLSNVFERNPQPIAPLTEAVEVLKTAIAAHRSADQRRHVSLKELTV